MNFTFKFGSKIKEAWVLYKDNAWNLILLTVVILAVSFLGQDRGILLQVISMILSTLVAYVWFKSISNLLDKKEFHPFSKESFPDLEKFWNVIKTIILIGLIFIGGFILLVIPGLYFMGRLIFAFYISIDEPNGARYAIKKSWEMTKGYGWKLFWYSFVIGLITILGFIAFFIGAFITYPIGIMLMVMMYRDFKNFKNGGEVIKDAEVIKEEPKVENKEESKESTQEEVKVENKEEVKENDSESSPVVN